MCATLRIVVGPSAKHATAASVITVSLMSFMSTSMPRQGAPGRWIALAASLDFGTHLSQQVHEANIALQAFFQPKSSTMIDPLVIAAAPKK